MDYEEKKKRLKQRIKEYVKSDCMIAFSGGVDSSLLLRIVCEAAELSASGKGEKAGTSVYAVTMKTRLHPVEEIENAAKVADEIGAQHLIIPVDELLEAGISDNPQDRCYLCKKYLFCRLLDVAKERGISTVLEGTNEEDLHMYRPGFRAIRELGIKSPLADAGFTKEEVRALAAEYELSVSDRPAAPCLATRFPYGTQLSYEKFRKVEQGEQILKGYGFYNVRLRVHDEILRIEVDPETFPQLLSYREKITAQLKMLGYSYVTLDLEGFRSGSMDIGLQESDNGV